MKNTLRLKAVRRIAGIIALALVIGFSMAACDNGSGDDDSAGSSNLIGRWEADNGYTILTANTWEDFSKSDVKLWSGTYTVSGNTMRATVTWVTSDSSFTSKPKVGDVRTLTIVDNTTLKNDATGAIIRKK